MARTNIDIDEVAVRTIMERFDLPTMKAAVNYAVRRLSAEAATVDEALALEGSGWDADLDELRGEVRGELPGEPRGKAPAVPAR